MRRTDKLSGESASSGLTIREVLFVRLIIETAKWREMKAVQVTTEKGQTTLDRQRGIIRGMTLSITKMYGNGYEPYWQEEVVACEQRANLLARQWIKDRKPENNDYWHALSARFWRSASDASSPDQRELRRRSYRA